MRVSTGEKFNLIRQALARTANKYLEHQQNLSQLKRIERPSDNPIDLVKVLKSHNRLNRISNFKELRNLVKINLSQIEATMDSSIDLVIRLKELAVSQASSTANEETRAITADEVQVIKEQLLSLANSQINGFYLFGGTKTTEPPYTVGGSYSGTEKKVEVRVNDRLEIPTTIVGSEFFSTGSENLFEKLDDFIDALNNNDLSGIQQALDDFNDTLENMRMSVARLGASQNWIENLNEADNQTEVVIQEQLSSLEDVDVVQETISLKKAETAYQAALAASSVIMDLNLSKYLK